MVTQIVTTPETLFCKISVKKFWGTRSAQLSNTGTLTLKGVNIHGDREEWVSVNHLTDPTRLASEMADQARAGEELGGQAHGTLGAANELLVRENLTINGVNPSQVLNPAYLALPGGEVEISDGIILYGNHAFMMQIKATMDTTKHISWFRQKIRDHRQAARKQANRSMEWLGLEEETLFTDGNWNTVLLDPEKYSWSHLLISKFDQLPVADPSRYMLDTVSQKETTINSKELGDLLGRFTPSEVFNFLRRSAHEQKKLFGFALINAFQCHLAKLYTGNANNPGFLTRIDDVLNSYPVEHISELRHTIDNVTVSNLQRVSKHYWKAIVDKECTVVPLTKLINIVVNSTEHGVEWTTDGVNIHLMAY